MKDYIEYDKIYTCECDSEFLRLQKYIGEEQIYVSKYRTGNIGQISFLNRIKLCIRYIFKPEKYDIHDGVILSKQTARDMGKFLIEITKDKLDTNGTSETIFGDK